MTKEILDLLRPQPRHHFLDGTFGTGGHSRALLEHTNDIELTCVDRDPQSRRFFEELENDFPKSKLTFVNAPYDDVLDELKRANTQIHGSICDLGISSYQVLRGERGMSYAHDGPLDLRFNPGHGPSAAQWLQTQDVAQLTQVLREFGEEPLAREIAVGIHQHLEKGHELNRSNQLTKLIQGIYTAHYSKPSRTPPAAKTFQAIRIALNQEFFHLRRFLEILPQVLLPGARAAFLTFHSLEDRIVKQKLVEESKDCICPPKLMECVCKHKAVWKTLKPFPALPSKTEVRKNPASRSAKLRALERLV